MEIAVFIQNIQEERAEVQGLCYLTIRIGLFVCKFLSLYTEVRWCTVLTLVRMVSQLKQTTINYPKKPGFNLYQLRHCAYITYSVKKSLCIC